MKGLSPELKVGVFALLVVAFLSFMTFKVGGMDWLKKQEGYVVYAHFKNIAGLNEKTKVRVAGVDAGMIEAIELVGGMARLTVRMNPEVRLYSDACASVKATGLLGDKNLTMTVGSKKPMLESGDTVKCIQEVMDVEDLVRNLTMVSLSLNDLLVKMNEALTKEDIKMVKDIVENLRDSTRSIKIALGDSDRKISGILENMDRLTASLSDLVGTNRDSLEALVKNLEGFSASLGKEGPGFIENLRRTSEELKSVIERSGPDIETIAGKAGEAMESLSAISGRLEKGEGTLGKLLKDEKLYDSLTSAASGVDRTISKMDRFRTFITFQGDYLSELEEGKGYFNVTIRPQKDKYYVLGVVSDPLGQVATTTTTTDGATVTEEKIEKDLEFTAHFARRHKDTALRLGLTETTFGMGLDQFFMDDKLRLSLDAWDFSDDEEGSDKPHVKFGADYFIYKNLFISGGVDNVLNSKWRGPYFGAGLMFEDEDFKYLFGTVPSIPGQ